MGGFDRATNPSARCNGMQDFMKENKLKAFLHWSDHNGVRFFLYLLNTIAEHSFRFVSSDHFSEPHVALIIPDSVQDFRDCMNILVKEVSGDPVMNYFFLYNAFEENSDEYATIMREYDSNYKTLANCYQELRILQGSNILDVLAEFAMEKYNAILNHNEALPNQKPSFLRSCSSCTIS